MCVTSHVFMYEPRPGNRGINLVIKLGVAHFVRCDIKIKYSSVIKATDTPFGSKSCQ